MSSRSSPRRGNFRTSVVSQQNYRGGYGSNQQQQQYHQQPQQQQQQYRSPQQQQQQAPTQELQWQAPPAAAPPADVKPEEKPAVAADGDVAMQEASENGTKKEKPAWQHKKLPKAERKKRSLELSQRRMRRAVVPKNAIVALQEICPQAVWTITECAGQPGVFSAEVTIDNQKYQGVGAGKSMARNTASERALQSFVKEPVKVTAADGTETLKDDTPWGALASFALHKLFCGWKQGEIGTPISLHSAATDKVVAGTGPAPPAFTPPMRRPLDETAAVKMETAPPPKKQRFGERVLPENALELNPVAVLFTMRPELKFTCDTEGVTGPGTVQQITVVCEDKSYTGRGRSRKIAKREAAKQVLKVLYNLDYPAEEPVSAGPAGSAGSTGSAGTGEPKQIATTYAVYT